MAAWFMRWLQSPLCDEFTLLGAEIATDSGSVATPENYRRDNVLHTRRRAHALNHGGAIA